MVDTGQAIEPTPYNAFTANIADQYAAMPSIHVGWAVLISIAVVRRSSSRWRWLAALHAVVTTFVVVATANHYWLVGIVAVALLVPAYYIAVGRLSERDVGALAAVNQGHLEFLASPWWAERLKTDLLPWVDSVGDLGDNVIEIGPGPGLTTDLVRPRVSSLTAIELDDDLAASLTARMAGTNVQVLHRDATRTGLPSGEYSTVLCFSMLHHMPSPELQDQLFAEARRLLRPGGMFVGVDAIDSGFMRDAHVDDTFVPVGMETVVPRFAAAGFADTLVEPADYQFRFRATAG